MNQLKKNLLILAAVISLGLVGAGSALGQLSCNANSVPTLVRSQGIAEVMGGIVFSCTGTSSSSSITVTMSPSAAVITNSPGANPTISINNGSGVAGNVSANTVTFTVGNGLSAPTIVLGFNPSAPGGSTLPIRANVAASGIVFPGQIASTLTSSPPGAISITNNSLNVAIPQAGLTVAFGTAPAVTQCSTPTLNGVPVVVSATGAPVSSFSATDPVTGSPKSPAALQRVTVTEGFPSSFTFTGVNGEGSDATQGTRFLFTLTDVPSNVVVVVANYVTNGSSVGGSTLILGLVSGADANGAGGIAASFPGSLAPATVLPVASSMTITYEVLAASNAQSESAAVLFGMYTIGTPSPSGTTSAVSAQMAPISTVGTPVTSPIPRFSSTPFSGTVISVVPCLTNILFPFVSNKSGYDTGFAIANTTSDPFGTGSQSGTCTYNFYGTSAPAGGTFTTGAFGGGSSDTRLLSTIAPGFSGYIIAQCNFQMGHGIAFMMNGFGGGAVSVSWAFEGHIIFEPLSTSGASSRKGAASSIPLGESLGF